MGGVSLEEICEENGISVDRLDQKIERKDLHHLLEYCVDWESLALFCPILDISDVNIADIKSISDPRRQRERFLLKFFSKGKAKYCTFLGALCEMELAEYADQAVKKLIEKGLLRKPRLGVRFCSCVPSSIPNNVFLLETHDSGMGPSLPLSLDAIDGVDSQVCCITEC